MTPALGSSIQTLPGEQFLLIGKNGYIGRQLTALLRGFGAEVTAVGSDDCNLLDAEQTRRFFQKLPSARYSVLFLAVINKSRANDYEAFKSNLALLENFVSAMQGHQVAHWSFFSSVDVYGNHPKVPITEESPIEPDTWYGLAKYSGEFLVRQALPGAAAAFLRLPGIYGGFDPARIVVDRLIDKVVREGVVTLHGDGSVQRDFVHAADLAKIVVSLAQQRFAGLLNIATGNSMSMRELVNCICQEFNPKCRVVFAPASSERNFSLCFDVSRLRTAVPDFRPMSFSDGLGKVRTLSSIPSAAATR